LSSIGGIRASHPCSMRRGRGDALIKRLLLLSVVSARTCFPSSPFSFPPGVSRPRLASSLRTFLLYSAKALPHSEYPQHDTCQTNTNGTRSTHLSPRSLPPSLHLCAPSQSLLRSSHLPPLPPLRPLVKSHPDNPARQVDQCRTAAMLRASPSLLLQPGVVEALDLACFLLFLLLSSSRSPRIPPFPAGEDEQ
jgi:hypothetical protein